MTASPSPFQVALSAIGSSNDPDSAMHLAEGFSVLQAHDVEHDNLRAIKIPVHIIGGTRADLEAAGFVWLEEPAENPGPADYVTVVPPEDWTVEVLSMYLTSIRDERGIEMVTLYDNHQFWDSFAKTEVKKVGRNAAWRLEQDNSATLASVRWHAFTAEEQAMVIATLENLRDRDESTRAAYWLKRLKGS